MGRPATQPPEGAKSAAHPDKKSIVERLKAKVESVLTSVRVNYRQLPQLKYIPPFQNGDFPLKVHLTIEASREIHYFQTGVYSSLMIARSGMEGLSIT